ncbi:hypothetical protein KC324_g18177 [Hortaea werneckii]|nr:hypothetical protein KC324_g18177 [Hortaea werneckii]
MSTTNGIPNNERLTSKITNPTPPNQDQAPSDNNKKTNPKPGYPDSIPATSLLADFITTSKPTDLPIHIQEKVQELLIDYIGVTLGAIQHAESTASKRLQRCKGFHLERQGPEKRWLPQYAGLLNAALGHSLDFDDTYAPGTLHAGVTAIPAALLGAEILLCQTPPTSGSNTITGTTTTQADPIPPSAFLHAIALGYETISLIGRELGFAAYKRGFHNTSVAGIFGAIAVLSTLLHLTPTEALAAFGLAGSRAAGSMQYLANGAWNKRLHPGFAVHDAWVCVGMARSESQRSRGSL